MISKKAYKGGKLVYRAYKDGKVIWDHGADARGTLISALYANAIPSAETPESILMAAKGSAESMGLPRDMGFEHALAYAYGTQTGNTIPRARETVPAAGTAIGLLLGMGAPSSFGLVFSRGLVAGEVTGFAMPHAVDIVYGRGTAEAAGSGYAMPYEETMLRIDAKAKGVQIGSAIPRQQEPERVLMGASAEMIASGCPTALPVCTVTFMHNGWVVHRETVIQGYDCPDPVATGVMDAPTKAATVSHTYEHSGWSRTEGGAAETGEAEVIFEEQTLAGFTLMEAYNLHGYPSGVLIELVEGETYQVTWDGKPYFCKAVDVSAVISGGIAIGNGSAYGYPGNGEPFMIIATPGYTQFFAFDDAASHTVSIIKGGGLNNIVCDTVVYAAFTESIRYYDISFYDEGKLLDTVPFAYGETPSYTAVKEGYICTGWTPELAPVTGEARYMAQWRQLSAFADATWDEIAMVAESGKADAVYAIGDQKTIPVTWKDGTISDVVFEIIGINHDNLADGNGKAGITLASKNAINMYSFVGYSVSGFNTKGWSKSDIRKALNNAGFTQLPEEVQRHIKEVLKVSSAAYTTSDSNQWTEETTDKLFIPSVTEFGGWTSYNYNVIPDQGAQYQHYKTTANRKKYSQSPTGIGTSIVGHATRSRSTRVNMYIYQITNAGALNQTGSTYEACLCFCI